MSSKVTVSTANLLNGKVYYVGHNTYRVYTANTHFIIVVILAEPFKTRGVIQKH